MDFGRVGIVGLGNMGLSMAINLVKQGVDVVGFDVSPVAMDNALANGIVACASLGEVVEQSSVLILSLPKAEHVLKICLGDDGVLVHKKSGLVVIDTTTSTPDVSRKIYRDFAEYCMTFVDAPVSGGPKGAITGTMSMVVGAEDGVYQTILPLLQKMSAKQICVGEVGAGNVVKIGNNLLVATNLITTAEVVSLAYRAGVAPEDFLRGLNQGSGRSAVSEVNFPTWILNCAYDSGFSMGLMRKDVGLAAQLSDELGLALPVSSMIMGMWQNSDQLADELDFNAMVQLTDDMFKVQGGLDDK